MSQTNDSAAILSCSVAREGDEREARFERANSCGCAHCSECIAVAIATVDLPFLTRVALEWCGSPSTTTQRARVIRCKRLEEAAHSRCVWTRSTAQNR